MPAPLKTPIGAHVSVAGGMPKALPRATGVGAECLQVFVGNPRGWAAPTPDPGGDETFRGLCGDANAQVFVHAPYLINFGSPSPETLAKSCDALKFSLRRGAAIGARAVVMHAGSGGTSRGNTRPPRGTVLGNTWDAAMKQVREHVLPLLDFEGAPMLLIEPTAGGGGALAASASTLADYLDFLGRDPRIGVCLDTCHAHASGHDMSSPAGFAAEIEAYAKAAGKPGIGLLHVNDSRDPAGSKRDRHEALGKGTIGEAPFAELFHSTVARKIPMVIETEDKTVAADIAFLKSLRDA